MCVNISSLLGGFGPQLALCNSFKSQGLMFLGIPMVMHTDMTEKDQKTQDSS